MYLAVGGVILRDEPPEGPAYERKELFVLLWQQELALNRYLLQLLLAARERKLNNRFLRMF
jgi:hypothetical protein